MTTLQNIPVHLFNEKIALLRADLNLPLTQGRLLDKSRLTALEDTLYYLKDRGLKVVLMSHFKRPPIDCVSSETCRDKYSLKHVFPFLQQHFPGVTFAFCSAYKKDKIHQLLKQCNVVVMENIRFFEEETSKNHQERQTFARNIASLGDLYVNEAFSASHRHHASITELPLLMPAYSGFSFDTEVHEIKHFKNSLSPNTSLAVLGGSKVSTKFSLIMRLIKTVNTIILGGGLANTFLEALGFDTKDSLKEPHLIPDILRLMTMAKERHVKILLPDDVRGKSGQNTCVEKSIDAISFADNNFQILDIGSKTQEKYGQHIKLAESILWNGPMGLFESPPFNEGSLALARSFQNSQAKILAGGGETLAVIHQAKLRHKNLFCSRGGGAFLDYMTSDTLPGLLALDSASSV